MDHDETIANLKDELAQMRAAFGEQQAQMRAIIAEQQTAIAALQAAQHGASAEDSATPGGAQTTRRGFLGAAALGAAAAAASVAAVGAVPTAHAATGGNMILGQANDANTVTSLVPTTSTTPTALFSVDNSSTGVLADQAIFAQTANASNGAIYGLDSSGGVGVFGSAPGGVAIVGHGFSGGEGVIGLSDTQYGIIAGSTTGIDLAIAGGGRFYQHPQGQAGAPTGSFFQGESIRDTNGDLWLCTASTTTNTPAVWVKVAHLAPGITSGGAINYLAKPIRLFDSRSGATDAHQTPGVKCSSAATTTVQVSGVTYNGVTVPARLAGAIGNVTVLNASGAGYIELAPKGAGFTGAANIAFGAGQVLSNAYNVGLATGALDIVIGGSGTVTVDVIIDLFAVVS